MSKQIEDAGRSRVPLRPAAVAFLLSAMTACATSASAPPVIPGASASAGPEFASTTVDLAACTVRERIALSSERDAGPRFLMLNGVPVTSLIYANLARELSDRVTARSVMIDLPGTGGSKMKSGDYAWGRVRACLREYLLSQPPSYLVVHDIAGPIVFPLLRELPNLKGVVVFNAVIKPTALSPPFPLNVLRDGGIVARPLAYSAPFFFYAWRLRDLGIARDDRVDERALRLLYDDLRADGGMGRLVDLLQNFDLSQDADEKVLEGLDTAVPQLFIWGDRDPVLGREHEHLPALGAKQRLRRIADAKHYLMMDYAIESADVITEWLADVQVPASE